MRRLSGWALTAAMLAAVAAPGASADAGGCNDYLSVVDGPEPPPPVSVITGSTGPDVLSADGRSLRLLRESDGRALWRRPYLGAAIPVPKQGIVVLSGDGACAQPELSRVDLRTGRMTARVMGKSVRAQDMTAHELYDAGLGNWDGDGAPDLLQVETVFEGPVVRNQDGTTATDNNAGLGQPSGHVLLSSPSWHAYLNVLSSAGRVIRHEDLGLGRGAAPTARWAADGRAAFLAVPTGSSTSLSLISRSGVRWTASVPYPASDVALLPDAHGVVLAGSVASAQWHAHLLRLDGFDLAGAPTWEQVRAGALDLLPLGADIALVDALAGSVERLDLRAGKTVWRATVPGPQETYLPLVAGDLDHRGTADLVLVGRTSSALAGESGDLLFSYPQARTFAVSDLDGLPGSDLITTAPSQDGQGEEITLRSGRDGHVVWTRALALGIESQDTVAMASKMGPSPLLTLLDLSGTVTRVDSRTGRRLWSAAG